ncbi:glycine betaine transporter [Virgibacillus natechei]|uniref:Glycine betaine transporter n=1 Tax=Virgibacillus natechei TaxID=1216297 RepID=A0ABS4IEK6_9BACI|nr:BCCT family transporter [Virgibacillus natechei]MBP1968891.1 glycine betaine transporter [Virgibacillus natechei]UZD11685.1 BCCT family transporter [Virgibacillus natechei]
MSEKTKENKQHSPPYVLYFSAILIFLFVLWGAIFPTHLGNTAGAALDWVIDSFGWYYMLIASGFVVFGIFVTISPFGNLRLGDEDDRPEHSFISWIGMLFAAGLGAGFVFFGVAEPVLYYMDVPSGVVPGTVEAAETGLRYGVFHWGLHAWGAFSIVGLTLAYVQYRKHQPALISSAFYPLIGDKTKGWLGHLIDILAVISTAAGVATTFGISALQMSGGISYLTPLNNSLPLQLTIISIVTVLFLISAVNGINKGIKRLTNINLVLSGLLLLFVLSVGPTITLMESMVTSLGGYASNIIDMSLTMSPFQMDEWLGANTIFFWAWHISWSPFVGLFIARISKGRTIREFFAGVLLVPTLLAVIWFSTFGGTALNIEMDGIFPLAEIAGGEVELTLFAMLEQLPLPLISSLIAVIVIALFFITSADSAAFVLGSMTSGGSLNPKLSLKIIWGLLMAGTASVLLVSGGGGLEALQTAALVAALPFAFVLILMIVSVSIMMSKDWSLAERNKRKKRDDTLKQTLRQETYTELKEELTDEWRDELRKELIAMGKNNAEMVHFQTNDQTAIVGKQIRDIGFPTHVNISAIERGDNILSPSGSTVIQSGDFLYILTESNQKEALHELLLNK